MVGEVDSVGVGLGLQSQLLTFPPFVELAALQYADSFADATAAAKRSTYQPEAFVSLQRQFSSRLLDLFLPSSAEVSWARELVEEPTIRRDHTNVAVDATVAAINLFGARGAYPTFAGYDLDELVSRWRYSAPTDASAVTGSQTSDLLIEHSVLLDFPISRSADPDQPCGARPGAHRRRPAH